MDTRKLSGELVNAIRTGKGSVDELLCAGASPSLKPYHDGHMILFRDRMPETPLDWAAFQGDLELVEKLLEHSETMGNQAQTKMLEMAAFSHDLPTLRFLRERFGNHANMAHAMAYALNQAFTDGAVYLYEQGAMQDVDDWYALAVQFRNFRLHYMMMTGRPLFDTGDDFYTFIFDMPGIDTVVRNAGGRAASEFQRRETIGALAEAGMLTEQVYSEFALRALLFDECRLLSYLDSASGFDFTDVFAKTPQATIELWIRPKISKRKIEIIASMLPKDFKFPLTPRYLTTVEDVRAILPYAAKETCEYPQYLVEFLVQYGCTKELAHVADWGGISADNIDDFIALGQKHFHTQTVAFLMEYKAQHFCEDGLESLMGSLDEL